MRQLARLGMLMATLAGPFALCGCITIADPLTLTQDQRSSVAAVQSYLNGLTVFQAQFTQTGWSGGGSGVVWVDRPGRLRLSYFGPNARDMLANGGLFVITDRSNGSTTTMPVAKTPLGLLLAPHISLNGDTVAVTGLEDAPDRLRLTLQDQTHREQGTLTLLLHKSPWLLVGVTATDIRGRSLTLQLSSLNAHPLITPQLFKLPPSTVAGS